MNYDNDIKNRLGGCNLTASEARKAQWQALKDQPLSAKLKHIFTYYWPVILGVVFVAIMAGSWISSALSQKEHALYGYLLNASTNQDYAGDFQQEFLDYQQIDSNQYTFMLTADTAYSTTEITETSMAVMESIMVRVYAGELDFLVMDSETYPTFTAYFTDLRTVLPQEYLDKWSDFFLYVEKEALDKLSDDSVDDVQLPEYYSSPEGLTDPTPMGIQLPADCRLLEAYYFPQNDAVLGVAPSCSHMDNLLAFLDFITE